MFPRGQYFYRCRKHFCRTSLRLLFTIDRSSGQLFRWIRRYFAKEKKCIPFPILKQSHTTPRCFNYDGSLRNETSNRRVRRLSLDESLLYTLCRPTWPGGNDILHSQCETRLILIIALCIMIVSNCFLFLSEINSDVYQKENVSITQMVTIITVVFVTQAYYGCRKRRR